MGSLEKLIEKFLNRPSSISLDECIRLLEKLGYELKKKSGSEMVFHKKGQAPINVPTPKKDRYVKSVYIRRLVKLLDLEECIRAKGGDGDGEGKD